MRENFCFVVSLSAEANKCNLPLLHPARKSYQAEFCCCVSLATIWWPQMWMKTRCLLWCQFCGIQLTQKGLSGLSAVINKIFLKVGFFLKEWNCHFVSILFCMIMAIVFMLIHYSGKCVGSALLMTDPSGSKFQRTFATCILCCSVVPAVYCAVPCTVMVLREDVFVCKVFCKCFHILCNNA